MSQYCVPSDLTTYAVPATALVGVSSSDQTAACVAASGEADSYMRARYSLPLSPNYNGNATYDPALVRHTAYIAAFLLMSKRGFSPVAGADQMIRENYYKAVGWPDRAGSGFFPGIERQHIHLDVVEAGASAPAYQLPQVWTKRARGI